MFRLFFLYSILLFSINGNAQRPQLQSWSVGEGLPQSQVYSLLCDRLGYVWAGTQGGGLGRFDGRNFQVFSKSEGLNGNYIAALAEGSDGRIWVGSEGGLNYFSGRQWHTLSNISGPVLALAGGPKMEVWAGTDRGLYQIKDTQIIAHFLPDRTIRVIKQIEDDWWVGTDRGLFRLEEGKWKPIYTEYKERPEVWDINQGLGGEILVASFDQGLLKVEADVLRLLPVPPGLKRLTTSLLRDEDGRLWVGTQQAGIFVQEVADSSWTRLGQREGLAGDYVRCLAKDAWGNVWIGISGAGLACYRGLPFVAFPPRVGIPGRAVYALSKDSLERLVISVDDAGLYTRVQDQFVSLIPDSIALNSKVKTILLDRAGWLWAGTEGQGVLRQSAKGWQWLHAENGLGGNFVRALAQDTAGRIWLGLAGGGLVKLSSTDSSTFVQKRYTRRDGYPFYQINDLWVDHHNRLWVATRQDGLICWEADSVRMHYTRQSGLPSNHIRSVVGDSAAHLWIGTASAGIGRLALTSMDTAEWQFFNKKTGLSSDNIYSLLPDGDHLWVGSERGVDKIELDPERHPRRITPYGLQQGFSGVETCTNAVLLDSLQNAWFGTVRGLMMYPEGRTKQENDPPPQLRFADVRLFYRSLSETAHDSVINHWGEVAYPLLLKYKENHLSFNLEAVEQGQPDSLRYRWKLENWDQEWSPWSTQSQHTYSNLLPGEYTFLAQASNGVDRIGNTLRLPISIEPPLWQRPWFKWAFIGLALLLLGLWVNWRIRRVRKAAARTEERLRLEKRAIELEQRALQLQMNPHFIFNALNGVQNLIGKAEHKTASNYLARFSRLMRGVLHSSRQASISLAEEIAQLEHYLALEQFSYGNRFQYSIAVDKDLEADADVILIPPMILQPLLENAIHHGIASRSTDGQIQLAFSLRTDELLEVTITDNGVGLQANVQKKDSHTSTALAVARERLEHLLPAIPAGKIIQLKSPTANNAEFPGTEVRVLLPILIAY